MPHVTPDPCAGVLEAVSDGVLVLAPDRSVLYVNLSAASLLGVAPKTAVGAGFPETFCECLDESGRPMPRRRQPWDVAFRQGRTVRDVDCGIRRKDGVERWLLADAVPLRDEQGLRVVVTLRDVTDRKRIERQAAEGREWLDGILDNTPAAVYVKDLDGRYVLANRMLLDLVGRERGEMVGLTDPDIFPSAMAEAFGANDRLVLQRGEAILFEEKTTLPEGTRFFDSHKFPLRDAMGHVIAVGGISVDVTKRRQLECEREELMAELRRKNEQLTATGRIIDVALSTLDLEPLLDSILDRLVEVMHVDAAVILLVEDGRLRARATKGFSEDMRERYDVSVGEGFAGLVAETRQPAYVYDALEDPRVLPFIREYGIRSMLGVPMLRGAELIGVLHVDWKGLREITPTEIDLLEIAADRCAWAIANARQYGQQRERKRLSDALNDINEAIGSTLDVRKIMERVVRDSADAISSDGAAIVLPSDGQWRVECVRHAACDMPGESVPRGTMPEVEKAVRTRRVVVDERPPSAKVSVWPKQAELVMAAPLPVRGDPPGALVFVRSHKEQRFSAAQEDFVRKLSSSLALALDNARLYEEERGIADTLQTAILTLPSHVPGVRFGHLYNSATDGAMVGGDFYDVFELEHGLVGVCVGDVSGKGLEAATLTSFVKNTLRAYAYDMRSPAETISRTSDAIHRVTPTATFVTLFFGVIDPVKGLMQYSSAGHPPSLVRDLDGRVRALGQGGTLAGAFAGSEYEQLSTELRRGDVLLSYTDGIIEARKGKELFGQDRLIQAFAEVGDASIDSIPERILGRVVGFSGGRLTDDIAILAVTPDPAEGAGGTATSAGT